MEKKKVFSMPQFYLALAAIFIFVAIEYVRVRVRWREFFSPSGLQLVLGNRPLEGDARMEYTNEWAVYLTLLIPVFATLIILACINENPRLMLGGWVGIAVTTLFFLVFFRHYFAVIRYSNGEVAPNRTLAHVHISAGMGVSISFFLSLVGIAITAMKYFIRKNTVRSVADSWPDVEIDPENRPNSNPFE